MSALLGKSLAILMIGNTHYIDIGAEKEAVIYYENATESHMILPGKDPWEGKMNLTNDGYHVTWETGASGFWQITYKPGQYHYVDGDGKTVGHITKITPGNSEGL